MLEAYREDLAYIHHVGFGDLALGAAPHLLARLRAAEIEEGRVVDLGCGGGWWLRELLGAGYEAIGIDASPHFIDLASRTAPGATLRTGSIYDVDLPPCRAVTALGEVLCYAVPGTRTAPPVPDLLQRVHEALEPGGLLIFDVIVADPDDPLVAQSWRVGDDWAVLSAVGEDDTHRLLTREIIAFRRRGEGYRRSYESHVQYLWSGEEIEAMLEGAGFSVETAGAYGDYSLAPRRRAFTALKA